jgi:hypothetical protein
MAATARIALFTLSVGLVGCTTQPAMSWFRADGKPVVPIQFEADEANCRDEVQKARLAGSNQLGLLSRLQAHNDVFAGVPRAHERRRLRYPSNVATTASISLSGSDSPSRSTCRHRTCVRIGERDLLVFTLHLRLSATGCKASTNMCIIFFARRTITASARGASGSIGCRPTSSNSPLLQRADAYDRRGDERAAGRGARSVPRDRHPPPEVRMPGLRENGAGKCPRASHQVGPSDRGDGGERARGQIRLAPCVANTPTAMEVWSYVRDEGRPRFGASVITARRLPFRAFGRRTLNDQAASARARLASRAGSSIV